MVGSYSCCFKPEIADIEKYFLAYHEVGIISPRMGVVFLLKTNLPGRWSNPLGGAGEGGWDVTLAWVIHIALDENLGAGVMLCGIGSLSG